MAEATLSLQASWFVDQTGVDGSWVDYNPPTGSRPVIPSSLSGTGSDAYFGQLNLNYAGTNNGQVVVRIADSQTSSIHNAGPDLSDAVETGGQLVFTASDGETLTLTGISDTTEPYVWTPTNSADVTAFANHVRGLTDKSLSLTIDDGQSQAHSVAADGADWSFETPQPSVTYGLNPARLSLFDATAADPGDGGDIGLRWVEPFTAFATEPNDTRAHLIANNQMAGGVTPATFEDPAGNERRIDWLVLHHGNDFVILNLDANLADITQADYRVAFRDRATGTVWTYSVRLDANEADPYEVPATQADLDAIAAVITGGGTLDAIIYDDDTAGNLAGWNANALTYDAPPMHMVDAGDASWSFETSEPTVTKVVPPTLFIADDGGDELWRIPDPASPGDAVLVGDLPAGLTNPKGLASYGGVLYCIDDSGNELWRIDPENPLNSTLIGTFPGLLQTPGGLVVHEGVMFVVDATDDELWRVDTVNPSRSVLIGDLPSGVGTPDGLASHNGVLYCCDSSSGPDLWIVDTEFPENSTEVGDFDSRIRWPNGLASHGGNLYCVDNDGDELWILDTTTLANNTQVGTLPSGLAAPRGFTSHEVPAPGTTTIAVHLGDDQMVRGDLDYALPATVTINNPVGVPVYLWERIGGIDTEALNDTGTLHPVLHTPDVGGTSSFTTFRLTVTNNGVTASDTIRLNYFPHLRAPAYPTPTHAAQTWRVGDVVNLSIPIPNGNPVPMLTADLPPDLSFAGLGQIQGVPQSPGSGTIVITATNSQGTDTYSIPYVITGPHNVDAADVTWQFETPQPSITHNQAHESNAGDLTWTFIVPEPMVTHVRAGGRAIRVAAGEVTWQFETPEPSITHVQAPGTDHVVNPGDLTWTFLTTEPEVTHDGTTIYVADTTGDELWRVDDPANPSNGTLVGAFPEDLGSPQGLEFHNGVLYCLNASILWRIDHENPANSVEIGPIPVDGNQSPQGLASHDGILYCVVLSIFNRVEELWAVDVDNPADSVLIGTLPAAKQAPGGLASHNGVLYCVDSDTPDSLWEIDPANPAASTRVGNFPADLDSPQGLTSHGGTLYCADLQGDQLWEIDPTDPSASTLLGTFPAALEAPRGMAGYLPRNQNRPAPAQWSFAIGRPSVTRTQQHTAAAAGVTWQFTTPEPSITHDRADGTDYAVNPGDVTWEFVALQPSATHNRALGAAAGEVTWSFGVFPEPTVTHVRGAATDYAVDAGGITWSFEAPEPSATHVRAGASIHEVNAGDVSWEFTVPEPSVSRSRPHNVDPADVTWQFEAPEPSITHTRGAATDHVVNAGDVAWTFILPDPTVTLTPVTPRNLVADAGDTFWSFAVPQPAVTHNRAAAQNHVINAGDLTWTFLAPEPAVTHSASTTDYAVDPADATWRFELPQPTVTHLRAHTADAGDVSFAFEIPQPRVTRTAAPAAPSFADNTGDPIRAAVGESVEDVLVPEADGNPAPTYAVVGNLPAGVSFSPSGRVLRFTPALFSPGSGTIRIRATNSEGMADWTVAYEFVAQTATPPSPPLFPRVEPAASGMGFDLVWEPPLDDGGGEITAYEAFVCDETGGNCGWEKVWPQD